MAPDRFLLVADAVPWLSVWVTWPWYRWPTLALSLGVFYGRAALAVYMLHLNLHSVQGGVDKVEGEKQCCRGSEHLLS